MSRKKESQVTISVKNLTKIYPNGKKANDSLDIQVNTGETIGIIGPNGAGKTTLVRQMLGLLKPSEGYIEILGKNIAREPKSVKGKVGYVPQYPLSFPSLTVKELITAVMKLSGKESINERSKQIIEMVGLKGMEKNKGYQLSSGSLKLLLMATALVQETKLLILDEPTSMVDIVNRNRIRQILKSLKEQGNSIFLATHDMNEAKELCDKIYIILQGKIIAFGSPEKISTLIKSPTEVQFVSPDLEKLKVFLESKKIKATFRENVAMISFPELSETIKFLAELEEGPGISYIRLESPSFEKAVFNILERRS